MREGGRKGVGVREGGRKGVGVREGGRKGVGVREGRRNPFLHCSPIPSAMATIARHVIANEYSEDVHENTSNSDTARVHSTISEDTREDSPLSTSSSQEQETGTVRN